MKRKFKKYLRREAKVFGISPKKFAKQLLESRVAQLMHVEGPKVDDRPAPRMRVGFIK
jgi:hypothetical protein